MKKKDKRDKQNSKQRERASIDENRSRNKSAHTIKIKRMKMRARICGCGSDVDMVNDYKCIRSSWLLRRESPSVALRPYLRRVLGARYKLIYALFARETQLRLCGDVGEVLR